MRATIQNILVVQTAFIGDVALIIPLLYAVRRLFPAAQLDVLVRPPAQDLLLTQPSVREVLVYDKLGAERGIASFLRWRKQLAQRQYDLALLPHRSLRSGLLAFAAGIPQRIGFRRGGGRLFHTQRVAYPAELHEIERNLQLLIPFAAPCEPQSPVIPATAEDVQVVDQKLGSALSRHRIALAPGSVWFSKRWPAENYLELGRWCSEQDWQIVLLGGATDRELCAKIAVRIGSDCYNSAGELTLRQSVEALRRCAALVTNDSAPTHLGVAAGIRVLTIFGSTSPRYGFAPFGAGNKSLEVELYCRPCTDHGRQNCPEKHLRCLRELTPEIVLQELLNAL